jgi:UDP-3-O-[3-hydroxymyristoyl] N-acetylglucosamine deacetylase
MYQKTLKSKINFKGVGLHSGLVANLIVKPAAPNSGITFVRVDYKGKEKIIQAHISNALPAKLCTTISNKHVSISTIEHLMSALSGMSIDNAVVEVDSQELPILDGSSKEFAVAIQDVGTTVQSSEKKYIKILKKIIVKDKDKSISIEPTNKNKLEIDYEIDFHDRVIKKQSKKIDLEKNGFMEVYDSRTFCLQKDLENIFKMGLAKGGSLENAIVVSEDKVLNQDGLRYKDEFVRHKILDCIGDLYLAGYSLIGKVTCYQGGHDMTRKFLEALIKNKNAWNLVTKKNQNFSSINSYSPNQLVVNL